MKLASSRVAGILMLLTLMAGSGCAGEQEETSTAAFTPSATTPSAAPQASSSAEQGDPTDAPGDPGDEVEGVLECQAPGLGPPGGTVLAKGCLTAQTIDGGGSWTFPTDSVLAQAGKSAPPCASFDLRFSWKVTNDDPSPATFVANNQGTEIQIGSGVSGAGDGYCGQVEARALDAGIVVDVRYLLMDCSSTGEATC